MKTHRFFKSFLKGGYSSKINDGFDKEYKKEESLPGTIRLKDIPKRRYKPNPNQ